MVGEKDRVSLPSPFDQALRADRNDLGPWRDGQPETARLAALDNYFRSGGQRLRVLGALYAQGEHGATDFELWQACQGGEGAPKYPHVAGTRRKELCDKGLACETAERRPTDTGSLAVVWRISEQGEWMFRRLMRGET